MSNLKKLGFAGLTCLLIACGQPDFYLPEAQRATGYYRDLETKHGLSLRPLHPQEPHQPWWFPLLFSYRSPGPLPELKHGDTIMSPPGLDEELSKYPSGFFRNAPLNGIYWVDELKVVPLKGSSDIGGMGYHLFNQRAVILESGSNFSYSIHHEIFHAVDDYSWFGNPDFLRCNPPEFTYGRRPELTYNGFDYPQPGFVSEYAMTAVAEDQAEVAAFMISSPESAQLLDSWIAHGDRILACKREAIQSYLGSRFPGFDSKRWALLSLGFRGPHLSEAHKAPETVTSYDDFLLAIGFTLRFPLQNLSPEAKTIPLSMPAAIGILTGLKSLHSQLFAYQELPAEIGRLTRLEELDLELAPLTNLPDSLVRLVKLKTLNLPKSRLQMVPHLPPGLETLNLGFGAVPDNTLDGVFAGQNRLKKLRLVLETQTQLPRSLRQSRQLETLELSAKGLADLPDWLPEISGLKNLKLSGALGLERMDALSRMEQLEVLELSETGLTQLPDLSRLKQLRVLRLSGNRLQEIAETILALPSLQILEIEEAGVEPDQLNALAALAQAKGIHWGPLPELDNLLGPS